MRAVDSQTLTAWKNGAIGSHVRVIIDGQDMTDLEGIDWIHSVTVEESVDTPVATATVKLHREYSHLTLATFRDDSKINETSTLVDVGKDIQVEVAVVSPDAIPSPTDWIKKFDGFIDVVGWAKTPVELKCRDKGSLIQDTFIETIRVYGQQDIEDLIQEMLDDNINDPGLGSVTLYSESGTAGTPFQAGDSPGFVVKEHYESKQSLMQALQAVAMQIGWDVRYRYNSNVDDYVLTLYAPARSKTTPEFTFDNRNQYYDWSNLEVSRLDVRNRYKLAFTAASSLKVTPTVNFNENSPSADTITRSSGSWITDGFLAGQQIQVSGSGLDPQNEGTFQVDSVSALTLTLEPEYDLVNQGPVAVTVSTGLRSTIHKQDDASITKYGRRYAEITEDSTSQIDSPTEAILMLNAALSDTAEPSAIAGVDMPIFPWVELAPGDLWQFNSNGVHFDSDQKLAPQRVTHSFEASGKASTKATLRGKISGGRKRWFDRMGGRIAPAIDDKSDAAPSGVGASSGMGSLTVSFDDPRGMSPPISDWTYTEVHISDTASFEPNDTTFRTRVRSTSVEIVGLVPGDTYYVRLIHYDALGNVGGISNEISQATQTAGPYHLNKNREYGVLLMNQDFGAQTLDGSSNMPDNWVLLTGTYGTDIVSDSSIQQTGDRSIKSLGSAAIEVESDFFPVSANSQYDFDTLAQYTGSGSEKIEFFLRQYDKDKSFISSTSIFDFDTSLYSASTWTRVQGRGFKVQASTRFAKVRFTRGVGSTTIYLDRVRAYRGYAECSVDRTVVQTGISPSTWTQYVPNIENYDYGNNYSGGFVAPFDGLYSLGLVSNTAFNDSLSTTGWQYATRFNINSGSKFYTSPFITKSISTFSEPVSHVAQGVFLSAGDTVVVDLWHNSANPGLIEAAEFTVRHDAYIGD